GGRKWGPTNSWTQGAPVRFGGVPVDGTAQMFLLAAPPAPANTRPIATTAPARTQARPKDVVRNGSMYFLLSRGAVVSPPSPGASLIRGGNSSLDHRLAADPCQCGV